MHAATLLGLWFLWLLAGQIAGSPGHELWLALSILVACVFAGRRFLRLLRRLRWLLLAILLTFSFETPGRYVIPDFSAGPTIEGSYAAVFAMSKLIAMAAGVAVLLEGLAPARLTGAIHRLVHPLSASHPAPDNFALRLQLVLHDLDSRPLGRNWMSWLEEHDKSAPLLIEPCAPFSALDLTVLAVVASLFVAWWCA